MFRRMLETRAEPFKFCDMPPPPPTRHTPHATIVGVVVNAVGGYSRGVLRGVASFAAARAWTLRVEGVNEQTINPLTPNKWSGFLVQLAGPAEVKQFARCRLPLVNVSSSLTHSGLPTVITDDAAVGRLGADHLLRLGYRTLVFHAPDARAFATSRFNGFTLRARELGLTPTLSSNDSQLAHLLKTLPPPLAVMGCNDRAALAVLDACRAGGRKVPDEVAVIGVDDDDLVQALAYPPLSTVNTARERVGFEAAAMLERLMVAQAGRGEGGRSSGGGGGGVGGGGGDHPKPLAGTILVPPKGVVARRSTDATAIPDPDVAEAARYIHAHAGQPIAVADVARAATVSRRQLERRFKSALGRSILNEITRCRVDRARQLLIDTQLTLEQVALASGFTSASYFSVVFKRHAAATPQNYRESFQLAR